MKDGRITVVGPDGKSDASGNFSIEFSPEYVKKWAFTKEYTLGVVSPEQRPLPLKRKGVMVAFKLQAFDKQSRTLDLGEIALE